LLDVVKGTGLGCGRRLLAVLTGSRTGRKTIRPRKAFAFTAAFDPIEIGIQPFKSASSGAPPRSQVEYEPWVTDCAAAEACCGDAVLDEMYLDPVQQRHCY
jgi:hypothetical protein